MVEHGARNLIYLSLSAGSDPEDQAFVRELETMGCCVEFVKGSVTNVNDVTRAVKGAAAPLKGILQMSMVLRDQGWPKMTWDMWHGAISPKVNGTWNLHHVTVAAGVELDFFVFFSSLSGLVGLPGQANYGSANTFLDAFCQYRTGLGLPASAIAIGVVEDFKSQDFWTIKEKEIIDALMLATSSPSPKATRTKPGFTHPNTFAIRLVSTTPFGSDESRSIWRKDPSVLKTPKAEDMLAQEISKKLLGMMMKSDGELNTAMGLADLGMDSLVATEMRMWWKQAIGFDINVLEML
ncbi:MAG: hypothetical protein Q9164_007169 [Protoblastenia rupestris]